MIFLSPFIVRSLRSVALRSCVDKSVDKIVDNLFRTTPPFIYVTVVDNYKLMR